MRQLSFFFFKFFLAFSSVESEVFKPVVDRNAFIVPVSHIDAVKDTITEKGITSKHILRTSVF